jgi:hypothetical protein
VERGWYYEVATRLDTMWGLKRLLHLSGTFRVLHEYALQHLHWICMPTQAPPFYLAEVVPAVFGTEPYSGSPHSPPPNPTPPTPSSLLPPSAFLTPPPLGRGRVFMFTRA